jgi:iron complex outermembrane receptor protein
MKCSSVLRRRALILAGTMLMGAGFVAQAHAEDAPLDEGDAGLGSIVVTAQKTETNLQKTPIAISVLGSDDLKARSVVSLKDLGDGAVPSLRIAPFASRNSALTVGIRGIVPFDANQPSRDAGVGIYIDGVYLGRSQGLGTALFDIERIEVLKGPQGTLFGRNSTGGALSIVSRKPSGEFHLSQTMGVMNYDGYKVETHLDLPSFANVSVKLDALVTKRGGTTDNPMAGEEDYNQLDQRGMHGAILWEPSSRF